MNKFARVALIVVVLAAVWGYNEWATDGPSVPGGATSTPVQDQPSGQGEPSGQDPAAQSATVVRVSDGDTVVVRLPGSGQEQRVRLVGIDTPEVFGDEVECGGVDASSALKALLPVGSTVTLTVDGHQGATDQYGRWLRYVESNGTDLGRQQVLDGNAEVYRSASFERSDSYWQAATDARDARRGIWSTCS